MYGAARAAKNVCTSSARGACDKYQACAVTVQRLSWILLLTSGEAKLRSPPSLPMQLNVNGCNWIQLNETECSSLRKGEAFERPRQSGNCSSKCASSNSNQNNLRHVYPQNFIPKIDPSYGVQSKRHSIAEPKIFQTSIIIRSHGSHPAEWNIWVEFERARDSNGLLRVYSQIPQHLTA